MAMGAKSDQVKGTAKEVLGATAGDEDLEAEGTADRRAGEMKQKVADVEDKVEVVIDQAKDSLQRK
jgi:uncharacterized protein YjbJ (UPF0337 family)